MSEAKIKTAVGGGREYDNFYRLLLLYNKTLSKHVTALFCLYLGNVATSANHFRNAPVGGHTCLTAGEQGEPAD